MLLYSADFREKSPVTAFRLIHTSNTQPARAAEQLCEMVGAALQTHTPRSQPSLALLYMNAAAAEQSGSVLQILSGALPLLPGLAHPLIRSS